MKKTLKILLILAMVIICSGSSVFALDVTGKDNVNTMPVTSNNILNDNSHITNKNMFNLWNPFEDIPTDTGKYLPECDGSSGSCSNQELRVIDLN
jgi:hypothetical protein